MITMTSICWLMRGNVIIHKDRIKWVITTTWQCLIVTVWQCYSHCMVTSQSLCSGVIVTVWQCHSQCMVVSQSLCSSIIVIVQLYQSLYGSVINTQIWCSFLITSLHRQQGKFAFVLNPCKRDAASYTLILEEGLKLATIPEY